VSKSRDKDLALAEKLALEAVERDPNNPRANWALGVTHRAQNRLSESRTELEKAITLDRNLADGMLQLGVTLLFSGEFEEALPYFEQALRLNPGTSNLHFYYFWIGFDCQLMNQPDRAVGYFRKACAALPNNGDYRAHLASALGLKGDTEEAKAELILAIRLIPTVGEYSSIAKLRETSRYKVGTPKFFAALKNTHEVGLRLAGIPDE